MSTAETIFGPTVCGADVEDWVGAVLMRWSCTYLAEIERQYGIEPDSLPDVRAWVPTASFGDKWPEDQLPAVLIASVGTSERPLKDGDGFYRARWTIRVGALCSAATQGQSRRLAMMYVAAHRKLLLQRPSLDGHAAGVDWLGEDYTLVDYDSSRTLYQGDALFTVAVDGVDQANAGPITPDDPREPCTDPWPLWVKATLVDVDVEKLPLYAAVSPTERKE